MDGGRVSRGVTDRVGELGWAITVAGWASSGDGVVL